MVPNHVPPPTTPKLPPLPFPYSLISQVGPVHPGAQLQMKSLIGCGCNNSSLLDADDDEDEDDASSPPAPPPPLPPLLLPKGFPIELIPRIPRTMIGALLVASADLSSVARPRPLPVRVQVPPFRHGCGAHGCSTISQRVPDRPSAQVHRYWSGAVFSQVPPCMHGSCVPQ